MDQMTTAFQQAGIQVPPVNQRIWQWLRDKNGAYTAKEIQIALKIVSSGSVGSALYDLLGRGMVDKQPAQRRYASAQLQYAWVALGTTFELQPVKPEFRRKSAKEIKRISAPVKADAVIVQGPTPVAVAAPAPTINIEDGMSFSEVRALYDRLHKIFGGGGKC